MSASARTGAGRMFAACAAVAVCVLVVHVSSSWTAAQGPVKLAFKLSEGTVLHYKSFNQIDQNYSGTDVTMNQTSQVDMSAAGPPDSTGAEHVDLKYVAVKASLVQGGQLRDWSPPIKLEGATIKIRIMSNGDVAGFDPGRHIPGLSSAEDLRELVDAWFVRFPDQEIAVGQSWTEPIVMQPREQGPPGEKGEIVYTLKKIEKRGNLDVAVIEGKLKVDLNMETPAGVLVGKGEGKVKAVVALNGGYIVEIKETIDRAGEVVVKDPITDKETRRQTAVTQIYERTLQQ